MQEASVSIPGMSRYAELQELARRKKEVEAKRQEEVGGVIDVQSSKLCLQCWHALSQW